MNILPNDPRLLDCSREELLFAAHLEEEDLSRTVVEIAATMIGTRWRPEVVHAAESSGGGAAREAYDFPINIATESKSVQAPKEDGPEARHAW